MSGAARDAKMPRPPLECELCGMPRWNDETVVWLYVAASMDRQPFCADECADQAARLGEAS